MVKKIFYTKVRGPNGRLKFSPVSEYDDDLCNSIGYGDHLLSVYKTGSSRKKIEPAFAPMIAAGRYSKDAVTQAIRDASDMRPQNSPITPGQMLAWNKLAKEFGEERHCLTWPAAQDAADAAVEAMQQEADKMLSVPAVRAAYDQFMLVWQLTKDTV